jgi:hypothetical protein
MAMYVSTGRKPPRERRKQMAVKAVVKVDQIRKMINAANLNVEVEKRGGGSIEVYAATENEMAELANILTSNRIQCDIDSMNKRCGSVFTRSLMEAN